MALQITKQPKCSKRQVDNARKPHSKWQMFKRRTIETVKIGLRYVLFNPAAWRLMMVLVPDLFERAELIAKNLISFFKDLF